LRLITWNINSVRLRIGLVRRLLEEQQPDVLCLQETKSPDELFPRAEFEALGYRHMLVHGMKGYNGVAILSRLPFASATTRSWCARTDCRHAVVGLPGGTELHNIYVPAGGDIPDPDANPKFAHKLQFLDEMTAWFASQQRPTDQLVLVGDLNVAPLEHDVWSHKQMLRVVSHTPIECEKLNAAQKDGGWVDAMRLRVPEPAKLYTWWSYRALDWEAADRGRRLDHIWVAPALADRVADLRISRHLRGWSRPSDHVPVTATLEV